MTTSSPHEQASDVGAAGRATATMLASRLVVALLGWTGSVIIARTLSPTDWGRFTFVFALLGLMAIFTDLGVGRAVMSRLIATDAQEVAKTASSFIALRVVLGLIGYVIAVGYVVALQYPGEVIRATAVGGLVVVFATPGHALTVIFQSRHRLLVSAVAESLGQAVQLAVTIAAAIFAPLLLIFVLAPVVNELVALTIKGVGILRRSVGLRPSRVVDVTRWKYMLTEALPLAIGFALSVALLRIDMLLLSLMDSLEAVGIYGIGYKFSDILDTLFLAAAGPIATLFVAAWPQQTALLRQRGRLAATAFAAGGTTVIAGFWPSADRVIGLLYGERFVIGADAARLLVVGSALMAFIVLGIFLMAATGFSWLYPAVAAGGLVLNVGLNVVLIPRYSYNGAAVATVVTLAVAGVAQWGLIAKFIPVSGLLPVGRLVALSVWTAVVCALGVWMSNFLVWVAVSAITGLLVGVPAVLIVRAMAATPRQEVTQ